jgi:hypothetical protein
MEMLFCTRDDNALRTARIAAFADELGKAKPEREGDHGDERAGITHR